jgi:hypothetical protein
MIVLGFVDFSSFADDMDADIKAENEKATGASGSEGEVAGGHRA